MLFQNAKHPLEMKVTHLNKVKAQRKHQLQLQMVDDKGLTSLISRAFYELDEKRQSQKNAFKIWSVQK
ncbi:MAG: hypothetical protein U1E91_00970 [Moraxella sp.]